MSVTDSEFGGSGGRVQKPPHELTPAEEARLMRGTDSESETDDVQAVLKREWEEEGRD